MIHVTLLIYLHEGQEDAFLKFESIAIPIMSLYNGKLVLRTRPTPETWINGTEEMPYEIHLISFDSEEDLQKYLNDEDRNEILHLKEQSIKSIITIKGQQL